LAKFKRFQKRHIFAFQGKLWPAITWQQIELESCSNPVMTSGIVLFRIKKKFLIWWGVLGHWDHDRGMSLVNFMTSSSDPMRQYFWFLSENAHF